MGPDLARRGVRWDLTQFAAAMWNKAPGMTAQMEARGIHVPQLDAGQMADLVAYLYSVQYFAESGDAQAGRQLLRSKGCLTCHSLNGQGARVAGDLAGRTGVASPAGVISSLWNHSMYMESADTLSVVWPVISSEEMADFAAFFATQSRN